MPITGTALCNYEVIKATELIEMRTLGQTHITTGSNNFNLAEFSGASGFYGAFGEELSFSGNFFSGLNASFKNEFGEIVSGTKVSSSNITGSVFSSLENFL